jgi:hypothetical protein
MGIGIGPASHEAGYGMGVEPGWDPDRSRLSRGGLRDRGGAGMGSGSVPPLTRRATGSGWSRDGIGIGPASHEV